MTPGLNKIEGLPDAGESDATQRVSAGAAEQPEATEPEDRRTAFSALRDAYARARDGRKRDQPEKQNRTAKSADRSEEHTSELQSLRHLVCRLLLEKKKKNHH